MKKRNRFLLWGAVLAVLVLMAASAVQAVYYDGYITNLLVKGRATITNLTATGTTSIGAGATFTSPTINEATLYTPTVSAATITDSSFAGTAALTTTTVSTSLSGAGTATSSGFLWNVAPKTADYTATAADNGKLIYFSGGGTKTLTLATATAGSNIACASPSGTTVTVNPAGTNQIVDITDAAGDSIQSAGAICIMLVSPVANAWMVLTDKTGLTDTN